MLNATKIKNNFNRASRTYDKNCSVQNSICYKMIAMLAKHRIDFPIVADIGCGTGESCAIIFDKINLQQCYGVDIAYNSLKIAKNKCPDAL